MTLFALFEQQQWQFQRGKRLMNALGAQVARDSERLVVEQRRRQKQANWNVISSQCFALVVAVVVVGQVSSETKHTMSSRHRK